MEIVGTASPAEVERRKKLWADGLDALADGKLVGLSSWIGTVQLGDWGRDDVRTRRLSYVDDNTPGVALEIFSSDSDAKTLLSTVVIASEERDAGQAGLQDWTRSEGTIRLDGSAHDVRVIRKDSRWFAGGDLDSGAFVVGSARLPMEGVTLERLTDVAAHIKAS